MSSKTRLRLICAGAGSRIAASFPLRVIPILSPLMARSISEESLFLASEISTDRIARTILLLDGSIA